MAVQRITGVRVATAAQRKEEDSPSWLELAHVSLSELHGHASPPGYLRVREQSTDESVPSRRN